MAKRRVDQLLVERQLCESREKAQALILAGLVLSDTRVIQKPGESLPEDAPLTVKGKLHPYASRGGLKLVHALTEFQIDVSGKTALDVGASTGGFTSCLLQHGARKVFCVDVGKAQLAWELRQDPRVVNLEGINARTLTAEMFPEPIGFVCCDVSFISLRLIIPAIAAVVGKGIPMVLLVKPQFEVGPREVGKGGVVRDPLLHERVCRETEELARQQGWNVHGTIPSPITGPSGNIEFLLYATSSS